jgi:pilus assembly protein CpaB
MRHRADAPRHCRHRRPLRTTRGLRTRVASVDSARLSLSLRVTGDNNAELERAIASGEVQVPENGDPRSERRMLLAIANQPVDSNPTFTVGGDVSRFQPRTAPRPLRRQWRRRRGPARPPGR